jgi:hypothetical protein
MGISWRLREARFRDEEGDPAAARRVLTLELRHE